MLSLSTVGWTTCLKRSATMSEQAVTTAPPGDLHWRYSVPPRTDSKMLLLTVGEVAVIGSWYGTVGEHFLAWCPLPKKAKPVVHGIEAAA